MLYYIRDIMLSIQIP